MTVTLAFKVIVKCVIPILRRKGYIHHKSIFDLVKLTARCE